MRYYGSRTKVTRIPVYMYPCTYVPQHGYIVPFSRSSNVVLRLPHRTHAHAAEWSRLGVNVDHACLTILTPVNNHSDRVTSISRRVNALNTPQRSCQAALTGPKYGHHLDHKFQPSATRGVCNEKTQ